MLTLSPTLVEVLYQHFALPLPLETLREHLAEGLGGSDADAVNASLAEVAFYTHRARTSYAQPTEHAVHRLEQTATWLGGPGGVVRWAEPELAETWVRRWQAKRPGSVHQQRKRRRIHDRLDAALLRIRRSEAERAARVGLVSSIRRDQLERCPWSTVATALLAELFPGGPHLVEAPWTTVPWRQRLLSRAKNPELLVTWFAPIRVRSALDEHTRGAWLGQLWARQRTIAEAWMVGPRRDWEMSHAFDLALRSWHRAVEAERAGELLHAVCPVPIRQPQLPQSTGPKVVLGEQELGHAEALSAGVALEPLQFSTHSPAWWDGLRSTAPDLVARART